jgi:hypothetical protein
MRARISHCLSSFAEELKDASRIPTTSYQHVFNGLMDCI